MTAVQEAIRERQQGLRKLVRWPWSWSLLALPWPLACYVLTVIAVNLAAMGWELAATPWRAQDLGLSLALIGCAGLCIEALRRLGQPSGISRDLLSAWWLPIALLLPPVYALIAPYLVGAMIYFRVRRSPVYRRVFSSAALGLAGASTSLAFHRYWPEHVPLTLSGEPRWLLRPHIVLIGLGCALLFSLVNNALVTAAAYFADRRIRLRDYLLDRESLLLDIAETCVGVLVAITCALSPLLLLIALPPVILLQRSLMHQQLQAAARTDAKTGLLNAATWQREAELAVTRAVNRGDPLATLLIDVDHFKMVNDRYGHLAGDQVLRALANELRRQVRESDIVGRFGGEEFTVLLPGTGSAEAVVIAERLRAGAAALEIPLGEDRTRVTVSVGVAALGRLAPAGVPCPSGGPRKAGTGFGGSIGGAFTATLGAVSSGDLFDLLAAADLALYRAKAGGRDQVCLAQAGEPSGPSVAGPPVE